MSGADAAAGATNQAGASGGASVGDGGGGVGGSTSAPATATYWQQVAPIYYDKCVKCHQEGGIAPFRLDTYTDAKANAAAEQDVVSSGLMPPYFMVHDDTCGSFHDEATLTADQKAVIRSWVTGGTPEGTPVTLEKPAKPVLNDAVDIMTPLFAPVPQGGQLAENDEYRCFLIDPPTSSDAFITGYDVDPGEPSIVHHVLTFIVDPAQATPNGSTNAAVIAALDGMSPDRLGWPCFGAAGDNVAVQAVPVTWAPGQGVVNYPQGMGVKLRSTDKLVVQIHYNLADPASAGKMDSTTIHLRFADAVERQLAFLLPDPFLDSLQAQTPDTLPPGQEDAKYTWTKSGREIGLPASIGSVDLVGVMPHMHGRGLRQTMQIGADAGSLSCASHLEKWDFHWQELYFYKTPLKLTPTSQIQVTCEYDTSEDTAPVLPGWGTRNEMCLNVMMVALPPS